MYEIYFRSHWWGRLYRRPSASSEELDDTEEKILKAVLFPGVAIVKAGYGFGQSIAQLTEAFKVSAQMMKQQ